MTRNMFTSLPVNHTLRARGVSRIDYKNSKLSRSLTFAVVLLAIAFHNAERFDIPSPTPGVTSVGIEYGWPLTAARGTIDHDTAWRLTGAQQFWRNTSNLRLDAFGTAANLAVAIVLSLSCANAFNWFRSRFNARLTIATILGTTAFVAIALLANKITDPDLIEEIPGVQAPLIVWYIFEYLERFVWFCVFVCCAWVPNQLSSRLKYFTSKLGQRDKNGT